MILPLRFGFDEEGEVFASLPYYFFVCGHHPHHNPNTLCGKNRWKELVMMTNLPEEVTCPNCLEEIRKLKLLSQPLP